MMAETSSVSGKTVRRPWYGPVPLFQRLILYAAVVYVALCTYLFLEQNSLEYPRYQTGAVLTTQEAVLQAAKVNLVPWDAVGTGAMAPQGYVRPDFRAPAARGTIVLFHGNGNWCAQRAGYVEAFARRGFRTFLYEYPGYGGRPGVPSERTIVPDARALIRSLDAAGLGPVYVWGESLGSGVSSAVVADPTLPVHGLMIVTPWDTVSNVGLYRYPYIPVRLLMTDRYDSVANLAHFQHPICLMRCTQDQIIPPVLSSRLYAQLPEPKKLIVQEGYGHDDWPADPALKWWDDALDFIAPQGGRPEPEHSSKGAPGDPPSPAR